MKELDPLAAALITIIGTAIAGFTAILTKVLRSNALISRDQNKEMMDTIKHTAQANLELAKALVSLQSAVTASADVSRTTQDAIRSMTMQLLTKHGRGQ